MQVHLISSGRAEIVLLGRKRARVAVHNENQIARIACVAGVPVFSKDIEIGQIQIAYFEIGFTVIVIRGTRDPPTARGATIESF
jgi:hypothetical protein